MNARQREKLVAAANELTPEERDYALVMWLQDSPADLTFLDWLWSWDGQWFLLGVAVRRLRVALRSELARLVEGMRR